MHLDEVLVVAVGGLLGVDELLVPLVGLVADVVGLAVGLDHLVVVLLGLVGEFGHPLVVLGGFGTDLLGFGLDLFQPVSIVERFLSLAVLFALVLDLLDEFALVFRREHFGLLAELQFLDLLFEFV